VGGVEAFHGGGAAGEFEGPLERGGFLWVAEEEDTAETTAIPAAAAGQQAAPEEGDERVSERSGEQEEAAGHAGGAITAEERDKARAKDGGNEAGDEELGSEPQAAEVVIPVIGADEPGGEEGDSEGNADDAGVWQIGAVPEEVEQAEEGVKNAHPNEDIAREEGEGEESGTRGGGPRRAKGRRFRPGMQGIPVGGGVLFSDAGFCGGRHKVANF
jgi:hypothetical protein